MKSNAFFFAIFAGLCSCSEPPKPAYEVERSHKYKVSVYTGGKEVKDFNTPLVQRLNLSPSVVASLGRGGALPVDGVSERDNNGKIMGVRIVGSKRGGNPAVLGLREKDLVTAVGFKPTKRVEDLRELATELERSKEASVTLERNGKPFKILYSMAQS